MLRWQRGFWRTKFCAREMYNPIIGSKLKRRFRLTGRRLLYPLLYPMQFFRRGGRMVPLQFSCLKRFSRVGTLRLSLPKLSSDAAVQVSCVVLLRWYPLFMNKSDSQLNNRDFQLMSDEELVLFLREGGHPESSDAAVEYLCGKYKSLVRNLAKPYYLPDGNTDDLIQEGMIGLFKAIRDYDPGKKAAFHTFATLCIRRQLDTAVKTSGREKNQALNNAISIYTRIAGAGEDGSGGKLADIIGAEGSLVETSFDGMAGDSRSPEDRIIEEENVRSLVQEITEILSPLESEVLNLYLDGNDYTAIAKILGRDEKSTDNALQRGRMKVRKILKERNQRRV